MAFNSYMHARNIYKGKPPDFAKLAEEFPEFKKHVQLTKAGKPFINFRSSSALRELTITLLKKDFGISLEIPRGSLVPTLPLRLNYILWLEDLLMITGGGAARTILDIGCGSSCIYPILGVTMNLGWTFIASEVDDRNIKYATGNVIRNNLNDKITVVKSNGEQIFSNNFEVLDACMCNPPFFNDETEMEETRLRPSANSSCSGSKSETISSGGDLSFALKILEESLKLRTRVKWYSTMLGKKPSLKELTSVLKTKGVGTITTTEFCQGNTMRWGVAWTFLENIPSQSLPVSEFQLSILQKKSKKPISVQSTENLLEVCLNNVKTELEKIFIPFVVNKEIGKFSLKIETAPSAWCNLRRKRRQQSKNPSNSTPENVYDSADKIELTIEIYKHSGTCKLCLIPSNPTTRDKVNNLAMYLRGKV